MYTGRNVRDAENMQDVYGLCVIQPGLGKLKITVQVWQYLVRLQTIAAHF